MSSLVPTCPRLSLLRWPDRALSIPWPPQRRILPPPAPFPINLGQSAYAGGSFTEPRACTQPCSSRWGPLASHCPRRAAGTAGPRGRRPRAAAGAEVRGRRCAALRARGWGRSCIAGERRVRPRLRSPPGNRGAGPPRSGARGLALHPLPAGRTALCGRCWAVEGVGLLPFWEGGTVGSVLSLCVVGAAGRDVAGGKCS